MINGETYSYYFDIDPEYFPQINESIIEKNPDLWKKFYPHETFVGLMKDTIDVINRKQKVSLWVEGAYGTGKSHAVLTLKKLIDASQEDTLAYFNNFEEQLNHDLYNKFMQIKSEDKKILTVHRYGSSNIRNDEDLIFAIQDSIKNALIENGINSSGTNALKDSVIQWLTVPRNGEYFQNIINDSYGEIFSDENVDEIIEKLNIYSGKSLQELMNNIMSVAKKEGITAMTMDMDGLVDWIREVIQENNFKAILFIWDEFTEYFHNNMRNLTGFQKIVDLSGSDPFYMMIVTHNVKHIFEDGDNNWKKILDRFVRPICNIELPENMAFRLIGSAMKKSDDDKIRKEWEGIAEDLYNLTSNSRELVKAKAKINDEELKNILPIHPYAALIMKHISSNFDSNQRSMFDFIKNDRGDDIKAFQWFIHNCGPYGKDSEKLLTVDMLWDFFYEKGKEYLSQDIRSILDAYKSAAAKNLPNEEERVLKAILLLQAISHSVGNTVDIFIGNEKNIDNIFEGTDLVLGKANSIAKNLIEDKIIYKVKLSGDNNYQYAAMINMGDTEELEKIKEKIRRRMTSTLITNGNISDFLELDDYLKLRLDIDFAASDDFTKKSNNLIDKDRDKFDNKIRVVCAFAKDEKESINIENKIKNIIEKNDYGDVIFIDASRTPLGKDLFEQYIDSVANSEYQIGKDNNMSKQYELDSEEVLHRWRENISNGEFIVYYKNKPDGIRVSTKDGLKDILNEINKSMYPKSLENNGNVANSLWDLRYLKKGVECGFTQKLSGIFNSGNKNTKLENYIGEDVWNIENYWEKSRTNYISLLKIDMDKMIKEEFEKSGRISISKIYEFFKNAPYGFMPCNLTAFVLGFLLKEYTNGQYDCTDNTTNSVLDIDKLKEIIDGVIKQNVTKNPRYKEQYIVSISKEERKFIDASSYLFELDKSLCKSIKDTLRFMRDKIRDKIGFPLWSLKEIADIQEFKTDKKIIKLLLDYYVGMANDRNLDSNKNESEIAFEIGKILLENETAIDDLKLLITKENCKNGMEIYVKHFANGKLISLSEEINDGGQYINYLKDKIDAEAGNWVWNKQTIDERIEDLILDYEIIAESNKYLPRNINYKSTIREWIDKAKRIRISYDYSKDYFDDLSDFLNILYDMAKRESLPQDRRKEFLTLLSSNGSKFNSFENNQIDIFKKSCNVFIEQNGLSENEVKEIFNKLPSQQFLKSKSDFQNSVKNEIRKFISESKSKKLKDIWYEKTDTRSPRDWSNKYKMPIFIMIGEDDENERNTAFVILDFFDGKINDNDAIENAIESFDDLKFVNKLSSKDERDRAFIKSIIKNYDVLFDDVDEVKDYLHKVMNCDPYDWLLGSKIDKKVEEYAYTKYIDFGCDRAMEKIENMDVDEFKKYLKELIKDNMRVGIEIIKEN